MIKPKELQSIDDNLHTDIRFKEFITFELTKIIKRLFICTKI